MTDIKKLQKEIKREQILNFVIKNRRTFLAFFVLLVFASVIVSFVNYNRNFRFEKASKQYLEAYNLSQSLPFNLTDIKEENQKNTLNKVKSILLELSNKHSGIFTDLSNLELADIYFKEGNTKLALEKLNNATKSTHNSSLKNLAKIKLASFYITSNENLEDAKKILISLKKESEFESIGSELLLSIYLKQNNQQETQELVKEMQANENINQSTKARLKKILQSI